MFDDLQYMAKNKNFPLFGFRNVHNFHRNELKFSITAF